jgi:hypothetical protein
MLLTLKIACVCRDEKKKSCEWHPIDFASDEAMRRQFKAYFSSLQAAQEFSIIFTQVCSQLGTHMQACKHMYTPDTQVQRKEQVE